MATRRKRGASASKRSSTNWLRYLVLVVIFIVAVWAFNHFTGNASKLSSNLKNKVEQLSKPEPVTHTSSSKSEDYDLADYALKRNFWYATPTASHQTDPIYDRDYYSYCWNEAYEQPFWVSYRLNDYYTVGTADRKHSHWRRDPMVSTGTAEDSDYKGSGFDRGHLMPAEDCSFSQDATNDSHYFSNACPQSPHFNRGKWAQLEKQVREWAVENRVVYVITGPVFSKQPDKIGLNGVAIPKAFFKIVLDVEGEDKKAIAFVMPHEGADDNLIAYAMSVDQAEQLTGWDFFAKLPDDLESQIEGKLSLSAWPF